MLNFFCDQVKTIRFLYIKKKRLIKEIIIQNYDHMSSFCLKFQFIQAQKNLRKVFEMR